MHDAQKAGHGSVHEDVESLNGHRFPDNRRLKRHADYQAVFGRHRKVSNQYFRILVHCNRSQSVTRLGIIVSRRVSRKSVHRNRIKRQIRECFRINQQNLQNDDMVVIAHRICEAATNEELRENLLNLFRQLNN